MNIFNQILKKAIIRDSLKQHIFDKELYIKHADGSTFKIHYACFEKEKIKNLNILIVYGEHQTPMVFVEEDLVEVKYMFNRTSNLKKNKSWINLEINSDFLK